MINFNNNGTAEASTGNSCRALRAYHSSINFNNGTLITVDVVNAHMWCNSCVPKVISMDLPGSSVIKLKTRSHEGYSNNSAQYRHSTNGTNGGIVIY